jgi:hypothetical protein
MKRDFENIRLIPFRTFSFLLCWCSVLLTLFCIVDFENIRLIHSRRFHFCFVGAAGFILLAMFCIAVCALSVETEMIGVHVSPRCFHVSGVVWVLGLSVSLADTVLR